ncbi:MAG: VOC family protein [Phycisphaerales bacterium]
MLTGLHHITAIAGDARRNLAFYTDALGLRLVKRTVNFDDPFTWHLYYGDEVGRPGTLITHFPHMRAARGRHGTGEIRESVLRAPAGALGWWRDRLESRGVGVEQHTRFGRERLAFADPDGMRIAIIEADGASEQQGFTGAGVDAAHALTSIDRAVIHSADAGATVAFLADTLGFAVGPQEDDRTELTLPNGDGVEVVDDPAGEPTRMAAGIVHHVAWRVPDEATQARVAESLRAARLAVTPVMDRQYFKSIYFRIPGGVIFEVATDGPGFQVDESRADLGSALRLPPQYEARRAEIESRLEPLEAAG